MPLKIIMQGRKIGSNGEQVANLCMVIMKAHFNKVRAEQRLERSQKLSYVYIEKRPSLARK